MIIKFVTQMKGMQEEEMYECGAVKVGRQPNRLLVRLTMEGRAGEDRVVDREFTDPVMVFFMEKGKTVDRLDFKGR